MKNFTSLTHYFSRNEIILWVSSALLILVSFCLFDGESFLTLLASLVGITSLLFNAKGNPLGQLLMVLFSLIYGVISCSFAYYGEMMTYWGMTLPMSVLSLVSWLKHPYKGQKGVVQVNHIRRSEVVFMGIVTFIVTVGFFFLLNALNTANLAPSTISVTTSFLAVYLSFRRSPYFALAYAANDIVLLVLWTLASIADMQYISVVVCFVTFLVNDLYGFVSWQKMAKKQWEAAEYPPL